MADASKPRRKAVRRKPKRATDAEFVAQVVSDAVTLGIEAAAEKHRISARTVRRYRDRASSDVSPDLSARVREKRADTARASQEKTLALLDFLETCMRTAASKASADGKLYEVAGAYKIVSDRVGADRAALQILGDPDAEPAEVEAPVPLRMVRGGA